jgi:hypothetical protein
VYKANVISPDRVVAYARHITYDACATKFSSLEASSTSLVTLLGTLSVNGISFHTTLTDTITQTWTNQTAIEIVLDLCETLDCQLIRDNHDAYLLPSETTEAIAQMAVGKNITSMKAETNWDNLVTRYIASVDGTPIDSTHISDYPLIYIEYLDDNTLEEAQATAAANYADGVDLPEVTVDITFAETGTVEIQRPIVDILMDLNGNPLYTILNELLVMDGGTELTELPRISDLALFDKIHAVDSGMGVDVEAQIVAIEYDALRSKAGQLTIGKARSRLTGSIYTKPGGTWQSA